MKTLAIIPCFNEQESLPRLLDEVRTAGLEAVVVNDASTDDTEAVAVAQGVPVLSLPVNLGIGGAVQTGFLYALRHGYDIAVQLDGDGQHDPAQLDAVLGPIRSGEADCVIGSRYLPAAPDLGYRTPVVRRLGMHFSSWILRQAAGLQIYDTTSGYRALNRRAFSYFARVYPVDHPEAEALLMLHQAGLRIKEVPTRMRQRTSGQSLFSFFRSAVYPLRVVVGFAGILFKSTGRTYP
jgi:glycosyltransferase involved in cell wall biosynthesis